MHRFILRMTILFLGGCLTNSAPSPDELSSGGKFDNDGKLNIELGGMAPDFTLPMSAETNARLADLTNNSNVVLVFYRGYWCPFCKAQLKDYEGLLPQMEKNNSRLVALSPDSIEDTVKFAKEFDERITFLADTNSEVIREYGLLRDEKLPHPAVIFIDQSGSILWFYVNADYKSRPSAAQIADLMEQYF
jgi:peroxiredoxin